MRYTTELACVVVAAAALAGEPAAAQISHQGQEIIDHVVLREGTVNGRLEPDCPSASFKGRALYRVLPDGTRASVPFTVPSGRQLVITDVEWNVDALVTGASLGPGETVRTRLQIGSGTILNTVFLSRTVEVASERGSVSGNEQLTTGFVVAADTLICPSSAAFSANTLKTARLIELVLRGYLIGS